MPLSRSLREECGIFGIYNHPDAASLTYLGLYALQHRGEESAGIVVSDGKRVIGHKGMGLAPEVFDPEILQKLSGHQAVGHIRYSTTGHPSLKMRSPSGRVFPGTSGYRPQRQSGQCQRIEERP